MSKYIDAEKLKAEIKIIQQSLEHRDVYLNQVKKIQTECMAEFCKCIFDIIDFLQREQPEELHFTPLNRLIQKIPSENWNDTVNNYCRKLRDCLIREGYRKDAELLQGYISYMNGNNVPMATMDKQEQPEVDLEKEMEEYFGENWKDGTPIEAQDDMIKFARHFYELGLNARKEENK